LVFLVPLTAQAGTTYARFRFSSAGGLSFDGEALDGEVEDYQVTIVEPVLAANASLTTQNALRNPRITQVQLHGADVVISFATLEGRRYRLECSENLALNRWRTVVDNVDGTGGTVSVTDARGAGQLSRFYRIRLLP
jgi:hypothetical protein